MRIILFTTDYRKTDVVKQLNNLVTFNNATLKYPTNHLNPIIRIDLGELQASGNNTAYPTYNYAYIEEFGQRFYFVENIVAFTNNIFDLYLRRDVLYTYIGRPFSKLRSASVFVERSSDSSSYDKMYEDNRISFVNNNIIRYHNLEQYNEADEIEIKNFTRDWIDMFNLSDLKERNVLISIGATEAEKTQRLIYETISTILPNTNNSNPFNFIETGGKCGYNTYALTYCQASLFLSTALTNDTIASNIRNIMVLPFSIPEDLLINDNTDAIIHYGNTSTQIAILTPPTNICNIDLCPNIFSVKLFSGTIADITNIESFTDTDLHAKYELYIPYVGWIDIPSSVLISEPLIEVFYNINVDNGDTTFSITVNGNLFQTGSATLGINIAPNTSNAYENSRKEQANNTQTALTTISGAIMSAVGAGLVATGYGSIAGIGMIVGGAATIAGGIGAGVSTGLSIIDRGQKGTSTSSNGLFLYDNLVLKVTKQEMYQPVTGAWLNENGRPVKQNKVMSTLRGYVELGKCDFDIGSVTEEQELIELLTAGVHFPTTSW